MSDILRQPSVLADADEHWILVQRDDNPAIEGFTLRRAYSRVDARYADDFVALLKAQATISNPKADRQPYTGTFANAGVRHVTGDPGSSERYSTIYNDVIKVASVSAATDLQSLAYRVAEKNEILNLFGFENGEGDSRAYVWDNLNPASRDECRGLTDASLMLSVFLADGVSAWATGTAYTVGTRVIESSIVYFCISAHTSGTFATDLSGGKWRADGAAYAAGGTGYKSGEVVQHTDGFFYTFTADHTSTTFADDLANGKLEIYWQYSNRELDELENNTLRLVVLFEKKDWDKAWASKRLSDDVNPDGLSKTKVYEVDGVPVTHAETVRAGITAESGQAIASTNIREGAGGKATVGSRQVVANAVADADVEIEYRPAVGDSLEHQTVKWVDVTSTVAGNIVSNAKTNATDMSAVGVTEPAPSGHVLLSIRKIPHDSDPLYDVIRVTYKPNSTVGVYDDWDNYYDVYRYEEKRYRRVRVSGVITDQYRTWTWGAYVLQTTSRTKAYDWAHGNITVTASGTDPLTGAAYADFTPDKRPVVQPFAGGRFRIVAINQLSDTGWTNE